MTTDSRDIAARCVEACVPAELRARPTATNRRRIRQIQRECRRAAKEAARWVGRGGNALLPRGAAVIVVLCQSGVYSHAWDETTAATDAARQQATDPVDYALDGIDAGAAFFTYPVDFSSENLRENMFFPVLAGAVVNDSDTIARVRDYVADGICPLVVATRNGARERHHRWRSGR